MNVLGDIVQRSAGPQFLLCMSWLGLSLEHTWVGQPKTNSLNMIPMTSLSAVLTAARLTGYEY